MDVNSPLPLLGGMTPAAFMRRYWQKAPLHLRAAWPGVAPPLPRAALFALAGSDDVESRLVRRDGAAWQVRHGPLPRRALPARHTPGWTLLVQGLDLHVRAAHEMLQRFRFMPDARLDDLMISWASPGGGVGPHVDSYDVFLLQVQGHRRWLVAPPGDTAFIDDLPLKILRHFEPVQEWLLGPGDMLYLPPGWGHDGVAEGGDCMTCSVGFRAPSAGELARELLQRLAEDEAAPGTLYRDPRQAATATPGAIPLALQDFARRAMERQLAQPGWLARALGEVLTEPKPRVWFDASAQAPIHRGSALHLDAGTRMMYDAEHVFVNGEAFRARGRDAALMRQLADQRQLPAADVRRLGRAAQSLVGEWAAAGWLHARAP